MDDDRIVTSSGFVVTPETVASRNFTTGFRGFDQGEVRAFLKRVSEELVAAAEREAQLRRLLQEAQNRAAHPEVDESVLTAALGEQAGRLLGSAREQAASIRAEAEAKASRLLRDTEAQISRVRSEADSLLARRVEEVDGVTANLRNAAEADARTLREQAKADAEAEVLAARTQGREMVAEARAVRERILADLARRRHISEVQLDQLRAARERLLEAYGLVRRTLEEATQELKMAEVEARLAAEEVGRRASPPPPPPAPAPPAAEIEYGPPTDQTEAISAEASDDAPSRSPHPSPAAAPAPSPGPGAPARSGGTRLRTAREAASRPEPRVRPPTRQEESRPPSWRRSTDTEPAGRHDRSQRETPASTPSASSAGSRPSTGPGAHTPPGRSTSPSQPASIVPRPVPPPPGRPAPAPTGRTTPPAPAGDKGRDKDKDKDKVNALFARIKADRASVAAKASSSAPAPADPAAPEQAHPPPATAAKAADEDAVKAPAAGRAAVPGDPEPKPRSITDEAARTRRDELLDPAETALVRQLKRGLQDEQNEVLDQLRRIRRPAAESVLLPANEHTDRFKNLAVAALSEAVRAGTRFADPDAAAADDRERAIALEVAAALAAEVVEPLRQRLEQSFVRGDDKNDENSQVAESVSAVYRQWRSQELEPLARHHAAMAFARGAHAGYPEGAGLRWLVDDEGPCPDCDDNELAGTVERGTPYPTGQVHPPAHPGCRCLLVPAVP